MSQNKAYHEVPALRLTAINNRVRRAICC